MSFGRTTSPCKSFRQWSGGKNPGLCGNCGWMESDHGTDATDEVKPELIMHMDMASDDSGGKTAIAEVYPGCSMVLPDIGPMDCQPGIEWPSRYPTEHIGDIIHKGPNRRQRRNKKKSFRAGMFRGPAFTPPKKKRK